MTAVLARLDDLDARMRTLEAAMPAAGALVAPPLATTTAAMPPPPAPPVGEWPQIAPPDAGDEPVSATAAPATAASATAVPATSVSSEAMLKWAGVGLVVLAAVFFVSTAIQRGWIGPKIQLAIAFAGGLALLAAAEWFRTRRSSWSLAFAHGGIVTLGLVSAVGVTGLDLYSTSIAAILIAGVIAASIAVAAHLDRASVASTGAGVGIFAPLLAGVPFDFPPQHSAVWVAVLAVIFTAVAVERGWVSLRISVIVVTAIPTMAAVFDIADEDDGRAALAIGGVVVVSVIVAYLIGFVATPTRRSPDPVDLARNLGASIDERLLGLLPGFAWVLVALLTDYQDQNETAMSFVAWGLAALFGVVFGLLRRAGSIDERRFFAGLVGCSVLVTGGLAGLIEGPTLLVALTAQALALGWLARRYNDLFLWLNAGALAMVSGFWAGAGMIEAVEWGASIGEHMAYLVVVLAVAGLAVVTHGNNDHGRFGDLSGILATLALMGWLLWLLAVLSGLPQGQLAVSIAWAATGAIVLLAGLLTRVGSFESVSVANVGLATLAVTVLKLVTVDLSAVDTIWRAGLFFVVGLGLLRLGLLIGSLGDADPESEATPTPMG